MTGDNGNFAQLCSALAESIINVTEHPQCPDYLAEILSDAALSIANEIEDDARVEDSIRRIFARLAVEHNPGVVIRAWVEPAPAKESNQ